MSAEEAPRRLTPTERLHEITMAFAQRAAAPPEHSIDLTRNAKGDVQISVTVRGHDPFVVCDQAQELFERLRAEYPHSSEQNGGGESA